MSETVQTVSIVDAVYNAIRDRVLSGELGPSEVLVEQKTAELYGVARPTAKAAIDRLVHQGLLSRTANKSARVPALTARDVRDIYFTRTAIESTVVALLAESHRPLPSADAALAAFERAAATGVTREVVDADIAFHQSLVDAVGSPRMRRMYASIIGEAHLCMVLKQTHHLHSPEELASEHRAIYEAILAGAADPARDRLIAHLDSSARAIEEHIRRNG
ncbi:GntR family transcriptional regulator [Microlunatus sp. Gsoil 973]|jgi:DNA-binding GntR family transcriptional regulator|uniref:GntR family transcriptional regulator n=1 Tax=Microlunatus sp. Gsoil 973 TaxID=2672569 RepID=UPI0012B4A3DD|nr:GntR family transcriptional regulator [Microlunatus sp. Gsoil 973]QGN34330.1 FCD domain-containing protein [Microlunatus sp. Gsoil 973]